jgi:hypothetical protein
VANLFQECDPTKIDYHGLCKCVEIHPNFALRSLTALQSQRNVGERVSTLPNRRPQGSIDCMDIWDDGMRSERSIVAYSTHFNY